QAARSCKRRLAAVRRQRRLPTRPCAHSVVAARQPEPEAMARPNRLRLQAGHLRLDVPPAPQGAPRGAEGGAVSRHRAVLAIAAVALLPAAIGQAASPAKHINGTKKADNLRGTRGADIISGRGGNDRIVALAGDDYL